MAFTTSGALNSFRENFVDLDSEDTKTARASRNFLVDQLAALHTTIPGFPPLSGGALHFGSFARNTKIRPLDDIDFLIILNGTGMTQHQPSLPNSPHTFWLRIDDSTKPLASFKDEHNYVNSTKILNKIRDSLPNISQYQKAEIRKSQQAVTLNLKSYDWIFDIVPAVPINNVFGTGISHYLIPDGCGDWTRTDPRKDAANMTSANKLHGGNLLSIMRLLKYWNNRTSIKPRLPSYYFETLVLNTFKGMTWFNSLQSGLQYFFDYGSIYLNMTCSDPKGLGPILDQNVTAEQKQKVDTALIEAQKHLGYAAMYDRQSDIKKALYWWRQVFGPNFPDYG